MPSPRHIDCVFGIGHAGEATAMIDAEKIEVIKRTRAQISKDQPLLAGVVPTGYPDAIRQVDLLREAQMPKFPIGSGFGFSTQALVEMAQITEVVAIKERSALMQNYEANVRAIAANASRGSASCGHLYDHR